MSQSSEIPTPSLTPRQQILASAVELFAERGLAGGSLRELAQRVGLHNSTLFHYFRDRGSLAASVVDAVAERQLEWLAPLADAERSPSLDQLSDCLDAWDAHLGATPSEARLLLDALTAFDAREASDDAPSRRLRSILEDWLGRAHSAGAIECPSPTVTARHLLAMCLFRPPRPNSENGDAERGSLSRFAIAALALRR